MTFSVFSVGLFKKVNETLSLIPEWLPAYQLLMKKYQDIASLLLRIATAANFLSPVADRFGLWGKADEAGVAWGNWANFVAHDASQMYSSNLFSLLEEFWNKETKIFNLNLQDEILQNCVITHGGEIVSETVNNFNKLI